MSLIRTIFSKIRSKPLPDKPVIMKQFKMDFDLTEPHYPSSEYTKMVILENNNKFLVPERATSNCIIIECENKPRDLPIWGIRFIELTD